MLTTPGLTVNKYFPILLDPHYLSNFTSDAYRQIPFALQDLNAHQAPFEMILLHPGCPDEKLKFRLTDLLKIIDLEEPKQIFNPSQDLPSEFLSKIEGPGVQAARINHLLYLADKEKVNALITDDATLISYRYSIYQHHRIRILPLSELRDFLETIAIGFSVFYSCTSLINPWTFDTYFQATHTDNKKLSDFLAGFQPTLKDKDLAEHLRSFCLNRYTFILYSRSMTRFYEIQHDHFTRSGLLERFGLAIGYFVSNFYLYLWGALEHLTVILKHVKKLNVKERQCGISKHNVQFRLELRRECPDLIAFLDEKKISEWIDLMADVRHQAAHRTILIPAPLYQDTNESKMPEDEIRKRLRVERPEMYNLGEEYIKYAEPTAIMLWRFDKMKRIIPRTFYVRRDDATGYFRDPVQSIDHDLHILNSIINKFFEIAFGRSANLATDKIVD